MSVKNVAPLWVEKHGITGNGAKRPIFGGFRADHYYYEL
jgi:hypothetical protein